MHSGFLHVITIYTLNPLRCDLDYAALDDKHAESESLQEGGSGFSLCVRIRLAYDDAHTMNWNSNIDKGSQMFRATVAKEFPLT